MAGLKALANATARRASIEIRRKPRALIRSPSELLPTIEFVAAHLATQFSNEIRTVVQVGAYDGVANDPVHEIVRRFGWNAVLVEPQPAPFQRLDELHSGNPRVQVFNVAISDRDGWRDLYVIEPSEGLPGFVEQIASFDRGHLMRAQKSAPKGIDLLPLIKAVPVETWTFETLLMRSGIDHVDVLQIDAEGYDYELLKLFNPWGRRPAVINYEHAHLSLEQMNAAADLLIGCGYRLGMSFTGGDTVAYLPK
jgi:FkbM family methyltransferase